MQSSSCAFYVRHLAEYLNRKASPNTPFAHNPHRQPSWGQLRCLRWQRKSIYCGIFYVTRYDSQYNSSYTNSSSRRCCCCVRVAPSKDIRLGNRGELTASWAHVVPLPTLLSNFNFISTTTICLAIHVKEIERVYCRCWRPSAVLVLCSDRFWVVFSWLYLALNI